MLLICPRCQSTYTIDDQIYAQQGAACQNCMEPLVPAQDGYGNGAQWGNQPQYGGGDAQWGNQPQYGGGDAQWGNQPQYNQGGAEEQVNMKTVGLDLDDIDKFTGSGGGVAAAPQKHEGSERTVALDLDDINATDGAGGWSSGGTGGSGGDNGWDAGNNAGGGVATVALDAPDFSNLPMPNASPTPVATSGSLTPGLSAGQIVVGNALPDQGNNQMTHQIDLSDVEKMYGISSGNPFVMFYRSLPKLALIISGALIGLALIGVIVSIVIANQPEKVEHEITSDGDIVVKGTPAKPLSFKEIAAQTKSNIPDAIPLDFKDISEGILIGVSESTGILYNNNKVLSLDEFTSTDAFNEKLFKYASEDHDTPLQIPIILYVDGSLPMSVVYRLMYTLGPTRRNMYIGGSTSTGITSFMLEPLDWPDHESHMYSTEVSPNTQLKITKSDIVLRRTNEKAEPLLLKEQTNEPINELRDEFLGGKVIYTNIQPALSRLRSMHQQAIRVTTDGNVKLTQFMNIVLHIQGNPDNPNVQKFLLDQVPVN